MEAVKWNIEFKPAESPYKQDKDEGMTNGIMQQLTSTPYKLQTKTTHNGEI